MKLYHHLFSVKQYICFGRYNTVDMFDLAYTSVVEMIPFSICIFNVRCVMPAAYGPAMITYTIQFIFIVGLFIADDVLRKI